MDEGKSVSNILISSELIGVSAFCRMIREQVPVLASTDLPILILGPTGTGKDIIARMIHKASKRADNPFLSVNCATLGNLTESELFGHVTGAFTSAIRGTRGFIGSVDGGTLLMDEVGELMPEVQAKLLRFLDNGEYFRVGEAKVRYADVRIIAATNQDMERWLRENRLREDLYYRLSGIIIRTVPLSERLEDIPHLVRHFIRLYAEHHNQEPLSITPKAIEALAEQPWPGNVRQLKYTVYRLCLFARKKTITCAQIMGSINAMDSLPAPPTKKLLPYLSSFSEKLDNYQIMKKKALAEFDYLYFTKLLKETRGSLKDILAISGMHKKNFYTKIKALGLNPKDFR